MNAPKQRILVCGGRDFDDRELLFNQLDEMACGAIHGLVVISGAARGADSLALRWAELHGVEAEHYPADWERHGKAAGPIRNQKMLREGKPDVVVAFPGGAGTADMVRRAERANVTVVQVER